MVPRWLISLCWAALCFTGDASIRALNTHPEFLTMKWSSAQRPVVVKFATPHCPACVVIDPVFKRLAQEYQSQVDFGEVNMNINQESHLPYQIMSVPTFIFFINGMVHHQGSITDEATLRHWTSSVAALSPPQPVYQPPPPQQWQQPQQPQQQQYEPQRHVQYKEEKREEELQQPRHGHPSSLIVSGACDSSLNDEFFFKGYTASDSPYYGSASNRHLYHDHDCNGRGSAPRWILDDYKAPIPSKVEDLDNDNDCRYRARIKWPDGRLPLGLHQWKVYSGSAWESEDLLIEDANPLATTTATTTTRTTRQPEPQPVIQPIYTTTATTTATTTTTSLSACAVGRSGQDNIENVVVIGAGPGGMAAALYAARAGLCPVVVAPPQGGQLLSKGVDVQNYPGVLEETGVNMIATMREQAERFDARWVNDLVMEVNTSCSPLTIKTKETLLQTRTIILAMGADSKWLGVQGEHEFRGHGVSSCAACDGFLFKGRSCAVIGGGETAIEEALMLSRTCSSVTMIHRRDKFRARQVLQTSALKKPNIRVVWNTVVEKFVGRDDGQNRKRLTHLQLKETGCSKKKTLLPVDAAFVAIGHSPNTGFLRGQVDLDDQGYVYHPSRSSQTTVPGVFAAGDVSDPIYRQAITSAGSGAMAALDAEKYLSELESDDANDLSNFTLSDVEAAECGVNIALTKLNVVSQHS